MNHIPLLSVTMPVYNVERYLDESIQSVLNQTFRDFEFLIIDDGSTDGSLEILRRYEQTDPRVKVVSRANTGQSRAMNEMIAMARGEFIARMDSDDISMPDRFQKQLDCLRAHPEIVAVGSAVEWIDRDGDVIRQFLVGVTHEEIDAAHLAGVGGAVSQPSAMFRRQPLADIGGMREEVNASEDIDVFLRLAEVGRLMNLPEVLLKWRLHPTSTGGRKARWTLEAKRKAVRDAHIRRGLALPDEQPIDLDANFVETPIDTQRMWAWWALEAKNVSAARKLAWAVVRQSPFNRASWMTMLCAVRGY